MTNFSSSELAAEPAEPAEEPRGAGISAVERETGLAKETLRVWERRYGFPAPTRDGNDERWYPEEQIEKLRLVRRLMNAGHRPGKLVALPMTALRTLAADDSANEAQVAPEIQACIAHLRAHRIEALRQAFAQSIARDGMARFVEDLAAPLAVRVGDLWMRGELQVFEEHLFTEALTVVLRAAIAALPRTGMRPRVLLTTFAGEGHGMGLLMAEAMLTLEGASCVSLGVETPVIDIARAAHVQEVDIVALSFSVAFPAETATAGLSHLRDVLGPETGIWAGGGSPVLTRRLPAGILSLRRLADIGAAVGDWRARHDA